MGETNSNLEVGVPILGRKCYENPKVCKYAILVVGEHLYKLAGATGRE